MANFEILDINPIGDQATTPIDFDAIDYMYLHDDWKGRRKVLKVTPQAVMLGPLEVAEFNDGDLVGEWTPSKDRDFIDKVRVKKNAFYTYADDGDVWVEISTVDGTEYQYRSPDPYSY